MSVFQQSAGLLNFSWMSFLKPSGNRVGFIAELMHP